MKVKSLPLRNITSVENREGLYAPNRVEVKETDNGVTVISLDSNNNDSTISPGGRNFDELPFGLSRGVDYTFIVELSVIDKLKGNLHTEALQMTFALKDNKGKIHWHYAKSQKGINEFGQQLLILHLNIPKYATGILRLNSGMCKNAGKVKWTNLSIVEGNVPLEMVNISDFAGLIEYDGSNLNFSTKYLQKYDARLYNIVNENEILSSLLPNHQQTVNKSYLQFVDDLKKAEYLGDKSQIITLLNENKNWLSERYSVDLTNFILSTHVYGGESIIERLTILDWVSKNLSIMKQMVTYNSSHVKNNLEDWQKLPVFVYWQQGIDKAPELIKATISRMKDQIGENLHILTKDNYKYYVDIPEDIEKLSSIAHWSDYLRVALLEKYGGIWLDSTLLIGNNFYDKLRDGSIIKEGNYLLAGYDIGKYGVSYVNWFMASNQKYNYSNSMIRVGILLWIHDHNSFVDYLHVYHLINALNTLDSKFAKETVKFVDSLDSYVLHHHLLDTNNIDSLIERNVENNLVNKLNHKFNKLHNSSDSLVSKIIRDNN